jgi:hypothetical protein
MGWDEGEEFDSMLCYGTLSGGFNFRGVANLVAAHDFTPEQDPAIQ